MSEGIKDMNQNKCNRNCGFVFDTEKIAACVGRMVLSSIEKDCVSRTAQPFVKHIFWHSKAKNDVFSLDGDMRRLFISSYTAELNGSYNITVNGIVKVKSALHSRLRIRPVLYQSDSDADFEKRSALTDFDVETYINAGVSVIPFSSVISVGGDDATKMPLKLGFVITASGAGDITGFSYTLSAVPSDSACGVEVLTPQGIVSDYRDESEPPLFLIKYPPYIEAEKEDYYE